MNVTWRGKVYTFRSEEALADFCSLVTFLWGKEA